MVVPCLLWMLDTSFNAMIRHGLHPWQNGVDRKTLGTLLFFAALTATLLLYGSLYMSDPGNKPTLGCTVSMHMQMEFISMECYEFKVDLAHQRKQGRQIPMRGCM